MSANGQLTRGELAPIWNGMLLAKESAASFNAMDAEAVLKFGRHIGVNDAYRPLGHPGDLNAGRWSQWAAWEKYQRGGNLAAHPGTSNHGLGHAVDLTPDGIAIVAKIGTPYGWAHSHTDAPSEPWHHLYEPGIWNGHSLATPESRIALHPLKLNSRSKDVHDIQVWLQRGGYISHKAKIVNPGTFGPQTQKAVKHFQRHVHLPQDGVVGLKTYAAIKRRWAR